MAGETGDSSANVHTARSGRSGNVAATFCFLVLLSCGSRTELDEVALSASNLDGAPPGDATGSVQDAQSQCTDTCTGFCAPGGCVVRLASSPSPADLTVDSESVYWTDTFDNTVMKIGLAGGIPTTLASGFNFPVAVA